MAHHLRPPDGDGKGTLKDLAYLMASGLLARFARMHGCPALAQFKHDGVSSSHLIFCERHRAQAVPFLRPPPGCGLCRGTGAASAVMPELASIDGFLRGRVEHEAQRSSVSVGLEAVSRGTKSWWSLARGSVVCSCPKKTSADYSAFPRL